MFCGKCGAQVESGAAFCQNCGAKQTITENDMNNGVGVENVSPISEKSFEPDNTIPTSDSKPAFKMPDMSFIKNNLNKIIGAGIALVAVIAVILIVKGLFGGGSYTQIGDKALSNFSFDGDRYIYKNGKTLEIDSDATGFLYNLDHTVVAYTDNKGTLYVVNDLKEEKEIAEDMYSYIIAVSGNAVAYTVQDDDEYVLYVYNVKNDTTYEIADDVYFGSMVLSPDGQYIAYISDSELFYGKIGKNTEYKSVAEDASPVAISNGKHQLVYINDDEELCLYNGKEVKIESDVDDDFFFNEDQTEMLFIDDKSNTYYYKVGAKEATEIIDEYVYDLIVQNDMAIKIHNSLFFDVTVYGKSSFKNSVLCAGDYYWLGNKIKEAKELDNIDGMFLGKDGKAALYIDGSTFKKTSNVAANKEGKKLFKEKDLYDLVISEDLKTMYVLTYDGELSYVKTSAFGEAKLVEISDDVDSCQYSEALGAVVYLDGDELYYAKKTEKSAKLISDDVDRYGVFPDGKVYYMSDDEMYIVKSGKGKLFLD